MQKFDYPFLEKSYPSRKKETRGEMPLIVDTRFCLQSPRAAHALRSDKKSFNPNLNFASNPKASFIKSSSIWSSDQWKVIRS